MKKIKVLITDLPSWLQEYDLDDFLFDCGLIEYFNATTPGFMLYSYDVNESDWSLDVVLEEMTTLSKQKIQNLIEGFTCSQINYN